MQNLQVPRNAKQGHSQELYCETLSMVPSCLPLHILPQDTNSLSVFTFSLNDVDVENCLKLGSACCAAVLGASKCKHRMSFSWIYASQNTPLQEIHLSIRQAAKSITGQSVSATSQHLFLSQHMQR